MKNLLTQIMDRLTAREQREALALAEETGWAMASSHVERQDFRARHFATAETYFTRIVEPARLHREMDDDQWNYWNANRRLSKSRLDPRIPVFVHAWNTLVRQKLSVPSPDRGASASISSKGSQDA